MPSITIRERDLTSAGNLEITTNAVYIPGYSNIGPTNVPTMCETLEDFQLIFGNAPYKFRAAQEWPSGFPTSGSAKDIAVASSMGNFYEKGEFEKSYIMAAEILKLGIPVLFERIFDDTNADHVAAWTASCTIEGKNPPASSGGPSTTVQNALTVKAKCPGIASSLLSIKIFRSIVQLSSNIADKGTYWVFTIKGEKSTENNIAEISPVITKFTLNSRVAELYSDCKLIRGGQTIVDNSGLVTLTFNGECNEDTYFGTLGVNEFEAELNFPNNYQNYRTENKDEFTVTGMYTKLSQTGVDSETGEHLGLSRLLDKGEYVIKFITTGAYPVFEYNSNLLANNIIKIAADRGDCTALIDHTPNNERTLIALKPGSVYKTATEWVQNCSYLVNDLGEDVFTYAAMFTPYGVYNCTTVGEQVMLPASHGYLSALASSVQTNGNWMAIAGVQRGSIPNLISLSQNLTNSIADSYEPRDDIAINPITNIKPYGLTIWGNRTLKNNTKKGDLTATSFLSIRQLTNDIKRQVWVAAKSLTFEQNSDLLWINFKSKIIPTLDQMVSGSGLSGYEIKKQKTTKKATVKAVIRLYAIEPVEDWDITIELADSSTEIAG